MEKIWIKSLSTRKKFVMLRFPLRLAPIIWFLGQARNGKKSKSFAVTKLFAYVHESNEKTDQSSLVGTV